jgi:two-component system, NtrC family, response regulator PilR
MPPSQPAGILVIDDEEIMREILEALLSARATTCAWRAGGAEGLELARACRSTRDRRRDDAGHGRHLHARRAEEDRRGPAGDHDHGLRVGRDAIAAMKRGAFDYITKPFKNDEVLVVLRNASSGAGWWPRTARCGRTCRSATPTKFANIIGRSRDAAGVRPDHPGGAEPLDDPDHGESGTGKELVARAIHPTRRAPTGRSSRSTRATCRRTCSSRTSSATSRAPSPAPSTRRRACSSWPTRARSSSTRSATSRSRRRPSCCA